MWWVQMRRYRCHSEETRQLQSSGNGHHSHLPHESKEGEYFNELRKRGVELRI